MVSQVTNCDSEGCPIDRSGDKLEGFSNISSVSVCVGNCEAMKKGGFGSTVGKSHSTIPSYLKGGIPVETMAVEDDANSDDDDEV